MKKGDDWEHEEERADDDLEQGDAGEDDDLLNTGVKGYAPLALLIDCERGGREEWRC